jgi:hypothetical protein
MCVRARVSVCAYSCVALISTKSISDILEMNGGYNDTNWRYARFRTHRKMPEALPPLLGVRVRTGRIHFALFMQLETQTISQAS